MCFALPQTGGSSHKACSSISKGTRTVNINKSGDDSANVMGIILVYFAVATDLNGHVICLYYALNPCPSFRIWPLC